MVRKIFSAAALLAIAQATTEIASTCLQERPHLYGQHNDDDLQFSDYNYLLNTEDHNTIYRMTRIQLCENSANELTGMRAHVTRYEAETMNPISQASMNRIGTVGGDGIMCNSIVLDVENGEYLTGMYFAYNNPGQIDYIRADTNMGQQISKGSLTSQMTASEMSNIQDSRILAFHGFEDQRIASIGQVSVNLSCIKGVTTTESVNEPILVDIEQIHNEGSSESSSDKVIPDEHAWIFILVGVLLGISIMVCLASIIFCRAKGMCCFHGKAQPDQVMPMQGSFKNKKHVVDLEFAGQSSAKKRQSIKQMSSIVEVDESSADIESKRNNKQKQGDMLQSIASMQVVTDTEAER